MQTKILANSTGITTYIVDSFTKQAFKGNPAGVCLLDTSLDESQMLNIAGELGFSETAFVYQDKPSDDYQIRFFSPIQEIDLCGHATLASAKVMFAKGIVMGKVCFKNINGIELQVEQGQGANKDQLLMTVPAYHTEYQEVSDFMLQALGIPHDNVISTAYNADINSLLIEIDSNKQALASLTPNFEQLLTSHDSIDGVVVTAGSTKAEYDFESRYFWPWVGTNEDPVTGIIHTFLTTYWGAKLGKTKMNALQCSKRSGSMQVELMDDKQTVLIIGEAQIIFEGRLNLDNFNL